MKRNEPDHTAKSPGADDAPGSGLFIGLAAAGLLAVALPPAALLLALSILAAEKWPGAAAVMLWAGLALLAATAALLILPILAWWADLKNMKPLRGSKKLLRGLYYPARAIGRIIGTPKARLQRSYLSLNNSMVLRGQTACRPEKVLVLLPHCLQVSSCAIRITHDPMACRRCGRCDIGAITAMCQESGVHIGIAPGGTMARRLIKELRPEMVIAVACERDLISGINDSYPLPVFGILNKRPNGPCFDTSVSSEMLEQALRRFVKP